jgi:putative addiction module killer protein
LNIRVHKLNAKIFAMWDLRPIKQNQTEKMKSLSSYVFCSVTIKNYEIFQKSSLNATIRLWKKYSKYAYTKPMQVRFLYEEWENKLSLKERGIVKTRLTRIREGNLGDCKPVKSARGINEIRIDFGPGYRIYYGVIGHQILLLLCGGDKDRQDRDISKAKILWKEYLKSRR